MFDGMLMGQYKQSRRHLIGSTLGYSGRESRNWLNGSVGECTKCMTMTVDCFWAEVQKVYQHGTVDKWNKPHVLRPTQQPPPSHPPTHPSLLPPVPFKVNPPAERDKMRAVHPLPRVLTPPRTPCTPPHPQYPQCAVGLPTLESAMDARPDYVPSSPLDDPLYAIPEEDHNRQNQRQSAESATRAPRFAQAEDEVKVRFRNLVVSTYDAYMKNMPVTKELTIVFDKYDMVESFKVGGDYVMANDFNDDLRRFSTNPQYIPPEVGTGRSYQKQAVEVWILGITLFWMLANKFPFSAKNDRTLLKKMSRSDFTIPSYLSNGEFQPLPPIHRNVQVIPSLTISSPSTFPQSQRT
ncbi:hypothetical protein BC936DRAFT_145239 [Jimgerdemannia flammicorona]|uniref:Protein kinase domain-containing protein n=1 Tax=Jimgerdemannia flammicorona TaxID=994334 RepID=A0A433DAI4_9FUNG|nr:hypothetical protein BC936DRAFT_145239 [Jimgerdemannia flammicorona]